MALAPYARQVARIAPAEILRWPDKPAAAVRQVAIDLTTWATQVADDEPDAITASVLPSDTLTLSGVAITDLVAGCTLTGGTAGTDYEITFLVETPAGRIEPFRGRVLVVA